MAICHIRVTTGSREHGHSAAAKAAYLARINQYGRTRAEVVYIESDHMPAWAISTRHGRRAGIAFAYWQAADQHERANGRLFREVEFALPVELDTDQQIALARAFAKKLTTDIDGGDLPYAFAIHRGKGHNPHCHLLISERVNDVQSRSAETWFRRAGGENGGARKTEKLKPQSWLEATRETWANTCNAHLARAGRSERIDHRSYADQGLDARPGQHLGPVSTRMAERGAANDRIQARDDALRAQADLRALATQKHIFELGLLSTSIEILAGRMTRIDRAEQMMRRIEALGALPEPAPAPSPRRHITPIAPTPAPDETGWGGPK